MKSLSQMDHAISATPKKAATPARKVTRGRTAPATAPAKWTKRNDESDSAEEEESSSEEEVGATTTTRSGRKSVGVVKSRKSLW